MAPPSRSRSVGRDGGFVVRNEIRCKEHVFVRGIGSLEYMVLIMRNMFLCKGKHCRDTNNLIALRSLPRAHPEHCSHRFSSNFFCFFVFFYYLKKLGYVWDLEDFERGNRDWITAPVPRCPSGSGCRGDSAETRGALTITSMVWCTEFE